MGAIAKTRLSTTAVSHVVQPLFDGPVTRNFFEPKISSTTSIAATADVVIGNKSGNLGSEVFVYSTKVWAIRSSSFSP